MLAASTVVGAAPGLSNLPDDPAAAQAGQPGPIVYPGLDLEAAGTTIAMHIVANAAAARRDSVRQRFSNRRDEQRIARPADPVGRSQRRNARAEETLRGIDVTDANDQMAIHQGRLDRPAAFRNGRNNPVDCKGIR